MGIHAPDDKNRFTLGDLGILNGEGDAVFTTIAGLVEKMFSGTSAAMLFSDEELRRSIVRATGPLAAVRMDRRVFLRRGSLTEKVCLEDRVIVSDGDPASWSPEMPELMRFRFAAFLAAPIHDPAGRAVGMLAAFSGRARRWSTDDISAISELADLASQRIMLKAALETVKRISREQIGFSALPDPRHH